MSRCSYIQSSGKRCCFEASTSSVYCAGCAHLAMDERFAFEAWMRAVTEALDVLCGLHRDNLPDCPYADWQRAGLSPQEAAQSALDAAMGNE